MESSMSGVFVYLLKTVMDLYLMVVIARLLLQCQRTSFLNPIAQVSYAITEPVLSSLRGFMPKTNRIDLPLLCYLFVLTWIEIILIGFIQGGGMPGVMTLIIIGFANILQLTITLYFYALVGIIILSWIAPQAYSPMTVVMHQLTEPLLSPVRNAVPPIAGIDFSALIVLLGLKVFESFMMVFLMKLAY